MTTVAENLREEVERLGNEIHLANAERTGWFAILPGKWRRLVERAKREGRDGPTLVVYRTATENPRDHWVIPYEMVRPMLTDATAPLRKRGARRWELTLVEHQLHVTHHEGAIDVRACHGLLLPGEVEIPEELATPTADVEELQRRVERLRMMTLHRPVGNSRPRRVEVAGRVLYERRADVKVWVLREAKGRCELCQSDAPFKDRNGDGFLEIHHVRQLAHGGPDSVENAVALCPNCHRRMHYGSTVEVDRQRLYRQVRRLVVEAGHASDTETS